MIGRRFGRLTVLSYVGIISRYRWWKCRCRCGKRVTVRGSRLRAGTTKSCGCLRKELGAEKCRALGPLSSTHGATRNKRWTRTYITWRAMLQRTVNRKHEHYRYYGGRGIRVCRRWRLSFKNFLADMGPRPEGKTLDRFPDRNGDYRPGNCRWATPIEQARNRNGARNSKVV